MWCSFIHKVIVYKECAHLCDKSERQMPSQPKEISDLNSNRFASLIQLPFLALSLSTISSGHLQAWSDLDQNGHHVFRNQWPLKCDCELYPKRMALLDPSQRKLPKDALLENSGHLFTCSLWVRLSAFIYLLENHLEELPQRFSPLYPETHTVL